MDGQGVHDIHGLMIYDTPYGSALGMKWSLTRHTFCKPFLEGTCSVTSSCCLLLLTSLIEMSGPTNPGVRPDQHPRYTDHNNKPIPPTSPWGSFGECLTRPIVPSPACSHPITRPLHIYSYPWTIHLLVTPASGPLICPILMIPLRCLRKPFPLHKTSPIHTTIMPPNSYPKLFSTTP